MIKKVNFYQVGRLKTEDENANRRDNNKDKILKFYINSVNSTMYNNV